LLKLVGTSIASRLIAEMIRWSCRAFLVTTDPLSRTISPHCNRYDH
jgi:hypothetical protein